MTETKIDDVAVRSVMSEVEYSFNTLNLEKLLSLHTDDIILMEPNMPVIEGKEKVKELFAEFDRKKIRMKLELTIHELEITLERAFVRGSVKKTTFENGSLLEDMGKFVCLLKKQGDGRWLRTHVIVNSDMPA
jgi:ketosteroid isomerase-like protein